MILTLSVQKINVIITVFIFKIKNKRTKHGLVVWYLINIEVRAHLNMNGAFGGPVQPSTSKKNVSLIIIIIITITNNNSY